jgi:hypothetical protein
MGKRFMRRSLAAAGVLTAGLLSGCQTGGANYAHTGVARGDAAGSMPTSPAFAQINAGRNLPMTPATGGMMMSSNGSMAAMPSNPMVASGQPVMGSGGMVYPVSYSPTGPTSMHNGTMPIPTTVVQQMPTPTAAPAMMSSGSAMPAGTMIPTPAAPTGNGQQTLLLIQGPNGPQYVISEVISSTPLPAAGGTSVAVPQPGTVITTGPVTMSAPTETISAPQPTSAPAPAPEPVAPAAPTFAPPPPVNVPMPSMNPTAPPEISFKAPATLPQTVSANKPTGPVLPVSGTTGPSLGSYPAAPTMTPTSGPRLPAASGVSDDEIPAAPVFLPSGR